MQQVILAFLSFMDHNASALIGLLGVTLGSILAPIVNCLIAKATRQKQTRLEKAQKQLLEKMLNHSEYQWRSLNTLKNVIGADESTTKILLLDLGARGTDDGKNWGLISRNPLPNSP